MKKTLGQQWTSSKTLGRLIFCFSLAAFILASTAQTRSALLDTKTVGKISPVLDAALAAPTGDSSTVCHDGSGPLVAALGLTWDVEPGHVARRLGRGVRLQLVNKRASAIQGTFEARLNAGERSVSVKPTSFRLKPGESRSIEVDPGRQPWDWQRIRSSGTIRAQIQVHGIKGSPQQVLRAPLLFFHRDRTEMLYYSADVLVQTFAGGDYSRQFSSFQRPNDVFFQHLGTGLALTYDPLAGVKQGDWDLAPLPDVFIPYGATTGLDLTGGGTAGGLADHRQVCLWLDTAFEDGSVGDYLTGDVQQAFGARYHLGIPWVGTYTGNASRSTGCFSLPINPTTDFYVTIFFESKVGYGNRNLRLRSFGDLEVNGTVPWSYENWVAGGKQEADVPRNSIHVDPSPGLDTIHLATHPGNVTLANLLGVASHGVMRLEEATTPPPSPLAVLRDMEIIPRDCPNQPPGTSCAGSTQLSISPEGSDTHRKFLIGHEVGHWYHNFLAGGFPPFDYSLHSSLSGCESQLIVGDHAMRSKEYEAGALTEGFAHFLSAYMFNAASGSDGWFKYYKQFPEYGYDYDLVDLLGTDADAIGGPGDVLHNVCGCADGSCTSGYGVELDWLRHYWRYYTDPGNQPSMAELFEQLSQADGDMDSNNVFLPLRDVLSEPLQSRWEQIGADLGADSTPW
ncbi:MAG: hypothetical protein AB7G75_17005 [Candidatus Binatia bacterium]